MSIEIKQTVQLLSISPIAFSMAKEGDIVNVRKKNPRNNEFRGEKIGAATVSYLIFKGITKIGMLPEDFVSYNLPEIRKKCKIVKMDAKKNIIEVLI